MANTSNWYVPNEGMSPPGTHTIGGGGTYNAGVIQYRSTLDAKRVAHGQLPYAQYPDGYLGTLSQDRRQDKLLDNITEKLNQRSYQRGVHKGEKIARTDYFWPDDANPMRRIQSEAQAVHDGYNYQVKRFAPRGNPVERLAHMGKTAGLSAPEQQSIYKQYGVSMAKNPVVVQSPDDKARMMKMLPQYARTM